MINKDISRSVFYIPGFDPRSHKYYYKIFKTNAIKTSRLKHDKFSMSKIIYQNTKFFDIDYDGYRIRYHFLEWNDIVQMHFISGIKDIFFAIFIFIFRYLKLFFRYVKESRTQLIAGLYPCFYVVFSYALSMWLSYKISSLFSNLIISVLSFVILFYILHLLINLIGKKIAVFWLLSIFKFCYYFSCNKTYEVDKRIDDFVSTILNEIKQNRDEILLIAHSVGTILAVEISARLCQILKNDDRLMRFKLVLLGECIPLVTFQKTAEFFRQSLNILSSSGIVWLDFTSKNDGACYYMFNYLKSDNIIKKYDYSPKFLSVKFFKIYKEATYKKIRYQWYKVHFLYLMATEISIGYDYFYIVCDKKNLQSKFLKE